MSQHDIDAGRINKRTRHFDTSFHRLLSTRFENIHLLQPMDMLEPGATDRRERTSEIIGPTRSFPSLETRKVF